MGDHDAASFGAELQRAIRNAKLSQADLARKLGIDPGQVSRWVHGKSVPHRETVGRIEEITGAELMGSLAASATTYELFVSAPITGLDEARIADHHDDVNKVVGAASEHVNGLYWPGSAVRGTDDLAAADLATERNLRVLASCSSYLYLQFCDVVGPSGALVELGIALGRRLKTTVIVQNGLRHPYMLDGFGAVAASLDFLPKARVYTVRSAEEAVLLVAKNGRELLGLS